ncbi:MAG: YggU family protein [Asgard group archaeon]|nr:YggU family protein [Asgard group archaeon]
MNSNDYLEELNNGIALKVSVKPNSREQKLVFDAAANLLFIHLKSPADKGKANKELIKLIAKLFNKSTSDVSIISGHTSRDKLLLIPGVTSTEVRKRIIES